LNKRRASKSTQKLFLIFFYNYRISTNYQLFVLSARAFFLILFHSCRIFAATIFSSPLYTFRRYLAEQSSFRIKDRSVFFSVFAVTLFFIEFGSWCIEMLRSVYDFHFVELK